MSLIKVYPAEIPHSHSFQGVSRVLAPFEQYDAFFYDLLPRSIQWQIEQVDNIDKATCVVYPVADFEQVIEAATHIRNTRPPCTTLISYIREHIDPQERSILAFMLRNTPDNCYLLLNGYSNPFPMRPEFSKVIHLDTFVGMYHRVSPFKSWARRISMLAGALENRLERAYTIAKCHELGIAQDMTITSIYNDRVRDNLLDLVKEVPRAGIVKTAIESGVFRHHLVDRDGLVIDPAHTHTLYTNGHEFHVPPQVTQSVLNVVLETRWWAPSVTEKIFKPIVAGVPFVWFGYPNIGEYLHSHGYKQYDAIDYKFDTLEHPYNRIDAMLDQVALVADGWDPRDAPISRHNQHQYDIQHREFHSGQTSHALLSALSGHRPV